MISKNLIRAKKKKKKKKIKFAMSQNRFYDFKKAKRFSDIKNSILWYQNQAHFIISQNRGYSVSGTMNKLLIHVYEIIVRDIKNRIYKR